jgi:hypothetical protein
MVRSPRPIGEIRRPPRRSDQSGESAPRTRMMQIAGSESVMWNPLLGISFPCRRALCPNATMNFSAMSSIQHAGPARTAHGPIRVIPGSIGGGNGELRQTTAPGAAVVAQCMVRRPRKEKARNRRTDKRRSCRPVPPVRAPSVQKPVRPRAVWRGPAAARLGRAKGSWPAASRARRGRRIGTGDSGRGAPPADAQPPQPGARSRRRHGWRPAALRQTPALLPPTSINRQAGRMRAASGAAAPGGAWAPPRPASAIVPPRSKAWMTLRGDVDVRAFNTPCRRETSLAGLALRLRSGRSLRGECRPSR